MALWNKLVNQTNRRAQGSIYEQQARQYLESQGLKFIEANATFKCGELDLVMQAQETFVFVEVRQRKSAKFGSAVKALTTVNNRNGNKLQIYG